MDSPLSRRQAIIALADARVGVNAIAALVGSSVVTVRRWIRRAKHSGFNTHGI